MIYSQTEMINTLKIMFVKIPTLINEGNFCVCTVSTSVKSRINVPQG